MNHEQLVINNLGIEIAGLQVLVADLKAQLEIKNHELDEYKNRCSNLQKENDSLKNSKNDSEVNSDV